MALTFQPDFDALQDLEMSWSLWHSLFHNWKSYIYPFGRGGAVNMLEEKDRSLTEWITEVFVEQPLASPGSAKYLKEKKVVQQQIYFQRILTNWK